MKRDAVLNLRVPAELKAALEVAAEEDLRTVSGLAVVLLMQALTGRGYVKKLVKKGRR
jgi:hypothetical protein